MNLRSYAHASNLIRVELRGDESSCVGFDDFPRDGKLGGKAERGFELGADGIELINPDLLEAVRNVVFNVLLHPAAFDHAVAEAFVGVQYADFPVFVEPSNGPSVF